LESWRKRRSSAEVIAVGFILGIVVLLEVACHFGELVAGH